MQRKNKRLSDFDISYECEKLAKKGLGHTWPNPPVGAIIVKGGKIIGRGYHAKAGAEHAEVMAINNCESSPKGATLYVTLEPCSTVGKVGPCTDAIIKAGIAKVFYYSEDPNPKNHGKAKKILAKAGVECEQMSEFDVRWMGKLICGFRKRLETGLPYVIVKIAMSLDGKTCDNAGNSKWITGEYMRSYTNKWRGQVDAIMVGAETIRKDNPSLTSREIPHDSLIRVVISKSGKLPKNAKVFTDGKLTTLVFKNPKKALTELGKMGIGLVLCEGGLKLATSMAKQGLVDEWHTIVAHKIIGDNPLKKPIRIKCVDVNENIEFYDERCLLG